MFKKFIFCFFIWLYACILIVAQIPANYYQNAVGKKNADLKTALFKIVNPHTTLSYQGLNVTFRTTDWHPDGYYWDMYSNYKRDYWSGFNREHSMPKSWFGVDYGFENQYPIGCDVHNLYPSDMTVNTAKSNFPLGVAGNSGFQPNSSCKVGGNTFPGYPGTVFEPANEYKGDFARTYMYMVTCYEDYATIWRSTGISSMLQNNTYPVFNTYAVNLLMKWHRSDPVSSKEINRNNSVYRLQQNRNPFIDFPVLAEYIWGKFKGYDWDGTNDEPETSDPLVYSYNEDTHKVFVKLRKPESAFYKVYSLTGKLVLSGTFSATSEFELRDSNTGKNFDKGIYILTVYTGGFRKTEKLLIY